MMTAGSTVLGGAGLRSRLSKTFDRGSSITGLTYLYRALFSKGEVGFAYDINDLSTLFQDAAGTTPVTAAGQPVGLMLDKSKGLSIGPELVVNGDFSADRGGWSTWSTPILSFSNGQVTISSDIGTGARGLYQDINVPVGKWVEIKYKATTLTGTSGFSVRDGGSFNTILLNINIPITVQLVEYTAYIKSNIGSIRVYLFVNGTSSSVVDYVSCKIIEGNHAYQSTSAARPLLQNEPILGPNLVTNGDFSNGDTAWTTTGTPTFTFDTGRAYYNGVGGGASGQLFNDVGMTVGKTYKVSYDYEVIQYGFMAGCVHSKTIGGRTITGKGRRHFIITVTDARDKGVYFAPENTSYTCEFYIDNVTVQEIIGYNKNIKKVAYDRIDDKLITNLPAQLTGCTVIRSVPNVGTQILTGQTIPATYEDNQDHCGLIVINRALTQTETAQITRIFNKLAGV